MNQPQLQAQCAGSNKEKAIRIVVAYEDVSGAKMAKCVLDHISEKVDAESRILLLFWKFTMLERINAREQAAREAAEADIIWISAGRNGELPLPVKAWVERSVGQRKRKPGALVLMRDSAAPSNSQSIRAYLRRLAEVGALEFFTADEAPSEEFRFPPPQVIPPPVFRSDAVERVRGVPRWGINE